MERRPQTTNKSIRKKSDLPLSKNVCNVSKRKKIKKKEL